MMKQLAITFILTAGLFSQSTSLALTGLGEPVQTVDPAALALGGSQYFSGRSDGVCFSSTSSLWQSALTRISMSTTFGLVETDILPQQTHQYFNQIGVNFKIGPDQQFGLGVKPWTRHDFYLLEQLGDHPVVQFDDSYFSSVSKFHGVGGISHFFLNYSAKVNEQYALGLQWDVEFGSQEIIDSILTYSAYTNPETGEMTYGGTPIETTALERKNRFSGNLFQLEGRYFSDRQQIVVSAAIRTNLKVVSDTYFFSSGSAPKTSVSEGFSLTELGIGYLVHTGENTGWIGEMHLNGSTDIPIELLLFEKNGAAGQSVSGGYFYRYDNPRIGAWNTLSGRIGAYFTRRDFNSVSISDALSNLDGKAYHDFGITCGLGMEYIRNSNYVDIGLKIGQRSGVFPEYETERYIELVVGLSTGEAWFVKRKRK